MPLRFAEEILLLLLDDENGQFMSNDTHVLHLALAGGVLMDLALESRIDTDLERLTLADATPTNDDLLDPVLAEIASEPEQHDIPHWLHATAARGDELHDRAVARLIERGHLLRSGGRFRRGARSRPRLVVDGKVTRRIRVQITNLLLSDELPDPRDIVVICLCDVCGLFDSLLLPGELGDLLPRIHKLVKLDLIAQAVATLAAPRRPLPPTGVDGP